MYRIFLLFTHASLDQTFMLSELCREVPRNRETVQFIFPNVDDLGDVDSVFVTNGDELHFLCQNGEWINGGK